MSEDNFSRWLVEVLKHEGGYVNHPRDPGGATNKGVTQATYDMWRRAQGRQKRTVREITDAEVSAIYRHNYWDRVKGDGLPSGVDYAVFDFAVNSGTGRASRYLQAVVGAAQDGVIGPDTIRKVEAMGSGAVIAGLCDKRLAFMRGLKIWRFFGKGWKRRVDDVRSKALASI